MNLKNAAPFPRLRAAYLRAIARAWHDPKFLQELVLHSQMAPRGALILLEKLYNFDFPFDVGFNISTKTRPQWKPIGTTGWFGFADNFEIYLPEKPEDPTQAAAVLARYCAEFPSLLGAATQSGVEAPPDFAAFGVVTSRILALTWDSKLFSHALFASHDARSLVQDSMDCIISWNFSLKFHQHPGQNQDTDEYWKSFPRSNITVHIPHEPKDELVEPIALASYNGTGSQYPFTCA